MKTLNLFFILALLWATTSAAGDHKSIPLYPIPSSNISVNGLAQFENRVSTNPPSAKERRQVHVHLTSVPPIPPSCGATVWIYSLDGRTVLGPYMVTCGSTLNVDIDEREWGVMVDSDVPVIVDVWITP